MCGQGRVDGQHALVSTSRTTTSMGKFAWYPCRPMINPLSPSSQLIWFYFKEWRWSHFFFQIYIHRPRVYLSICCETFLTVMTGREPSIFCNIKEKFQKILPGICQEIELLMPKVTHLEMNNRCGYDFYLSYRLHNWMISYYLSVSSWIRKPSLLWILHTRHLRWLRLVRKCRLSFNVVRFLIASDNFLELK